MYHFSATCLDSTGHLTGTQAASASMYSFRRTGYDSLNTLYVGLPGSVGTSVRVRLSDAERNFLTAEITFCHGSAPPLSKKLSNEVILAEQVKICNSFLRNLKSNLSECFWHFAQVGNRAFRAFRISGGTNIPAEHYKSVAEVV